MQRKKRTRQMQMEKIKHKTTLAQELRNKNIIFEYIIVGKDDDDNDCLLIYIKPKNFKNISELPKEWNNIPIQPLKM